MIVGIAVLLAVSCLHGVTLALAEEIIFAVVTQVPKDRKQVIAQVVAGDTVSETTLVPNDAVLENAIWRKLEVCHSLRADATKDTDGYRLMSVKMLDAGMLPMPLQGLAGDCLLKKALEFAPLVD